MKKIRIAQIGVCHEHAAGKINTLKRLPEYFEIAGVVDDNSFSRTPKLAGGDLTPYAGLKFLTLEEALNDPTIEAVTVEVPNNDLVPMAIRCMERNWPMHLDKPAGEDPALYRKLLDGCRERNLPLQMGFMFRGNPAFRFCIEAIRSKLIGEVFEIEADMNHCYGGEEYQEYIGKFSGGIMYNLGCHLIDFVAAAMGRPEAVTPFLKSAPGDRDSIRNNCMAVLEYPHAIVTLRTCSRTPGNIEKRRIRIAGTGGVIEFSPVERFDGKPVEVMLLLAKDANGFPAGTHTLRFPPQADRYEEQLIELAKMIRGEMKNPYSYEHDYLVEEITLAASGYTKWR